MLGMEIGKWGFGFGVWGSMGSVANWEVGFGVWGLGFGEVWEVRQIGKLLIFTEKTGSSPLAPVSCSLGSGEIRGVRQIGKRGKYGKWGK
jgi:hypothetical protein